MTNEEAIQYLISPIATSTEPSAEYLKQKEAYDLVIKALEERKQGEWIIVKDEKWGDNVKCPFCGKELAGTDLNFCCKCGAKLICSENMNGGAE